jgi:hypothetical protein
MPPAARRGHRHIRVDFRVGIRADAQVDFRVGIRVDVYVGI